MRGKIVFILLLIAAITIPIASACSDEWLIENAIAGVKADHPKHQNTVFYGVITSGWQHDGESGPYYKYVTLTANFGYHDQGTVLWKGMSYSNGDIYTLFYSNHDPDPPKFDIVIVYLGPLQYWDGSHWITNQPQSIINPSNLTVSVQLLGSNGMVRTYELNSDNTLLVYPPIGVEIDLSILT